MNCGRCDMCGGYRATQVGESLSIILVNTSDNGGSCGYYRSLFPDGRSVTDWRMLYRKCNRLIADGIIFLRAYEWNLLIFNGCVGSLLYFTSQKLRTSSHIRVGVGSW